MTIALSRSVCMLAALSAGCAAYQSKPLAEAPSWGDINHVVVDAAALPPVLSPRRYDPSDGLDIDELATLAVANNRDLAQARADARVSRAQAFAAGLLPDPQLSLSHDLSNNAGPGASTAFSAGLSVDIVSLLNHSRLQDASAFEARKADLNLLWQEWQVVAQARLLFVKLTQAEKLRRLYDANRALFADRNARLQAALAKRLITADIVAPNLTALQDVDKQLRDLERQTSVNRHALNTLLGLAPATVLVLQGGAAMTAIDEAALAAMLPALARRRPDLAALAAGYQAQDRRYRAAILAQFPALTVGFTRSRDSGNVYSNALGVSLSLPVFNRNRGNIAIEQATREKLGEEYQSRLQATLADIARIVDEQAINARQAGEIRTSVAALETVAANAALAHSARNIDVVAYAAAQAALLARQVDYANLEQAILEQRIALLALTGGDFPTAASSSYSKTGP